MTVVAEIFSALLSLLDGLLQIYMYVVFGAVIISWVNADPYNPIVRFIRQITDPVLLPVRRKMWGLTSRLQLDLSPMIVIFGIIALQILIRNLQRGVLYGL